MRRINVSVENAFQLGDNTEACIYSKHCARICCTLLIQVPTGIVRFVVSLNHRNVKYKCWIQLAQNVGSEGFIRYGID